MSAHYSHNKKMDGKGHMVAYATAMQRFDLSDAAIKEFATALKNGQLDVIKKLFSQLTDQQQLGLLRLHIDYNDIENTSIHNQRGFALDLAKKFGHQEMTEYFLSRQKDLPLAETFARFTKNASSGLFSRTTSKNINKTFNSPSSQVSNKIFGKKTGTVEKTGEIEVATGLCKRN